MGDEGLLIDPSGKGLAQAGTGRMRLAMSSSILVAIALLLFAGVVWFGFYATHTKEVSDSDDREYASIARNITNGKGIVRNFIYPLDINFFNTFPIPEFVHPPGYPLILAGFFKVLGISDFAALLPSYLSFFGLVLLLFLFVKRYLGIQVAALAAVILIFNKQILDISLIALSEAVYTFVFFLFFVLLVNSKTLRGIFFAGILLGVSHLIRENIYPFLLPILIYLYFYPELPRLKKMTLFILGILIPILPNIIRTYLEMGSPFFSYGKFVLMAFTAKYPGLNIYREIQNPSLFEFLTAEPGQFFLKYASNLAKIFEQFMSISNPYLMAPFFVEMFYWKVSPEWKKVKLLFLFLLISQILFLSLFTFTHRFLFPFLPVMTIFASQCLFRFLPEGNCFREKRFLFLSLVLFLTFFAAPTLYTILQPYKSSALKFKTPQYYFLISRAEAKKLNEFLKVELKDSDLIWTDLPEILEWEGDRSCGWLPTRVETIHEIHKKIPVDAILLTSVMTPHYKGEEWRDLLFSGDSLPGYRTVKLYRSGVVHAKLLIRDGRE